MRQSMQSSLKKAGLGTFFAVLACSLALAQDVTTNSMPGTDFGKYHTYKWVTIEGAEYPNQILDAQIKASVDKQLASKGLTKPTATTPIFISATRPRYLSLRNGTHTALAACGGAAVWELQPSPLLIPAPWSWICMIRRRKNLSGKAEPPRHWIRVPKKINGRRIWIKPQRSY